MLSLISTTNFLKLKKLQTTSQRPHDLKSFLAKPPPFRFQASPKTDILCIVTSAIGENGGSWSMQDQLTFPLCFLFVSTMMYFVISLFQNIFDILRVGEVS